MTELEYCPRCEYNTNMTKTEEYQDNDHTHGKFIVYTCPECDLRLEYNARPEEY